MINDSLKNKKKTILIADDEATIRKSLAFILEKANYHVIQVDNGVEAIFATQQEVIDLVIMDLKMRNIDGLTTIDSIYNIKPQIPVIILTAFANDLIQKKLSPNVIKYFSKPIDTDELLLVIENNIGIYGNTC